MQTAFPRQLAAEILDELSENDPEAIHSRRDLQKINRIMGSAGMIARALRNSDESPKRILEIGAGDGTLMLGLAKRLARSWPNVHVILLDRQDLVSEKTREGFLQIGWTVEVLCMDIETWLLRPYPPIDICIANLFIHHFTVEQIRTLFAGLSTRVNSLVACEPRRGHFPLLASRLIGLLGANHVTRNDAVLSVKAGFSGQELSALWAPVTSGWQIDEGRAGLFSHLFVARRQGQREANGF